MTTNTTTDGILDLIRHHVEQELEKLLKRLRRTNRHDAHHPRPLPINGHAYHQRRRNRTRRRR